MTVLYNENEPFCCAWLRELMADGLITEGVVDERSIEDVTPAELAGRTRCHFFSGIGLWDYALNLAGFPADREVWSASLPCQPFSQAGKGDGFADERHLWAAFFWHVRIRRPQLLIGEQVASPDGLAWFDLVRADLEACGYTVGACITPAAGYGAPHGRHRIYWVARLAVSNGQPCGQGSAVGGRGDSRSDAEPRPRLGSGGEPYQLANAKDNRTSGSTQAGKSDTQGGSGICNLANAVGGGRGRRAPDAGRQSLDGTPPAGGSEAGTVADAHGGQPRNGAVQPGGEHGLQPGSCSADGGAQGGPGSDRSQGFLANGPAPRSTFRAGPTNVFWGNALWLPCTDGKYRPIKPGAFPLVDGASERVVRSRNPGAPINADNTAEARTMRIRGYGNAIVLPQAVEFIRAVMTALELT